MLSVCGAEVCSIFFFNDAATTEIYTLSLHDALPILVPRFAAGAGNKVWGLTGRWPRRGERTRPPPSWTAERLGQASKKGGQIDRKSTRLNSSHANISYAVFCLKKKNTSYYCTPQVAE